MKEKWSRIFTSKRFGKTTGRISLSVLEQQELLDDMEGKNDVDFSRMPERSRHNQESIEAILATAKRLRYSVVMVNYDVGMIRFRKNGVSVNLYTTNYTVTTELDHPRQGKTQLHRKGLSHDEVIQVLTDPRKHTGKGYHRKKPSV